MTINLRRRERLVDPKIKFQSRVSAAENECSGQKSISTNDTLGGKFCAANSLFIVLTASRRSAVDSLYQSSESLISRSRISLSDMRFASGRSLFRLLASNLMKALSAVLSETIR